MFAMLNKLGDLVNQVNTELSPSPTETPEDLDRNRATQFVQELDDGLTVDEKAIMIMIFTNSLSNAKAYLQLVQNNEVRLSWLRMQLKNYKTASMTL
jgi:hypothetical protein